MMVILSQVPGFEILTVDHYPAFGFLLFFYNMAADDLRLLTVIRPG